MAKSRRGSKVLSNAPTPSYRDVDTEQNTEEDSERDCADNSTSFLSSRSFSTRNVTPTSISTKPEQSFSKPELSFSHQHSLTFGNYSNVSLFDASKPKLQLLNISTADRSSLFNPPGSNVVNRFVEEQEPYDTGSDSEAENKHRSSANKTASTQQRKWPLHSWFTKKSYPNPVRE